MADQAVAAELEFSTRPIYENKEICEYLVSSVKASLSLQILPSTISNAGSGLFTAEDMAAGQEIFRSTPVVQCPSYYQDMTVCNYCYSSAEGYGKRARARHENGPFDPLEYACARCKLKNYCSLECKRKAWAEHHQQECDIASQMNPYPTVRLLVRLLHKRAQGDISDSEWNALLHLQTNRQARMMGPEADKALQQCLLARQVLKTPLETNSILDLYCMINANTHNMYNPGTPNISLGAALDLLASLMNHDCEANAFVIFEGGELRVRSQRPIAAGGEITISYVTPGFGVSKRKKDLADNYYFDCQCERCQRETKDISTLFSGDPTLIKTFSQLSSDITTLSSQHIAALTHKPSKDQLTSLLSTIETILKKGLSLFPSGDWPSHLEPMPYFMSNLASLYSREGHLAEALIYQLNGLVSERQQYGLHWAWRFYGFLLTMMRLASQPEDPFFADVGFAAKEMMILCAAYHEEFLFVAKETFGEDAEFTKGIWEMCGEWVGKMSCGMGVRNRFAMDFVKFQVKLFDWADVDKRMAKALSRPRNFGRLKELGGW